MDERVLYISIANSHNAARGSWKNIGLTWAEFITLIKNKTKVTNETFAEYTKLDRAGKTKIKDIGGFVGGFCLNGIRDQKHIAYRDFITLDHDYPPDNFLDIWGNIFPNIHAIIHSTHSYCAENPRVRIIIPLDRRVHPAHEYQAIIRKIADKLDFFKTTDLDTTTFDREHMMYWPSSSRDAPRVFECFKGDYLSADKILNSYDDWHNWKNWARLLSEESKLEKNYGAQKGNIIDFDSSGNTGNTTSTAPKGNNSNISANNAPNAPFKDPRDAPNLTGLFNTAFYPIDKAIKMFNLPYKAEGGDRYTYTGGTSDKGAWIKDGLYLYSHHAHDPANDGNLHNAFDLVKLHCYIAPQLKEIAKEKEKLKALKDAGESGATIEWLENQIRNEQKNLEKIAKSKFLNDIKTTKWILYEIGTARAIRSALPTDSAEDTERRKKECGNLELKLYELDYKGNVECNPVNIGFIMALHPDLKNLLAWNNFSSRVCLAGKPRWRDFTQNDIPLKDRDDAAIRDIFFQYGIRGKDLLYDAVTNESMKHAFHPVQDYLKSLKWDNTPRIATAITDFFGGVETPYTREISTLFFKAGVMRVFNPGCKYDYMLIIKGRQGCGKSTFFRKLGREWFNDSIKDVTNKDALEALLGSWIIEFGEMAALKKADADPIKGYLSAQRDRFRPAYGRRTEDFPRQCVFAGTTNEAGFLYDQTGNRRFLVFEVPPTARPKLSVFEDLTDDYVNQLWAEAYTAVKAENFNSRLYLPYDIEQAAESIRSQHMRQDPLKDLIERYLDTQITSDWYNRDRDFRRNYIQKSFEHDVNDGGYIRMSVCPSEVWFEATQYGNIKTPDRLESSNIVRILDNLPDWHRATGRDNMPQNRRIKGYGLQKCVFERNKE